LIFRPTPKYETPIILQKALQNMHHCDWWIFVFSAGWGGNQHCNAILGITFMFK